MPLFIAITLMIVSITSILIAMMVITAILKTKLGVNAAVVPW